MSSCTVHVNLVKLATSERRAVADLEILKGVFSGECSEQRCEVLICHPRKARKNFFAVIFQLPGWAIVAPSCFALHCHCSLVSVLAK